MSAPLPELVRTHTRSDVYPQHQTFLSEGYQRGKTSEPLVARRPSPLRGFQFNAQYTRQATLFSMLRNVCRTFPKRSRLSPVLVRSRQSPALRYTFHTAFSPGHHPAQTGRHRIRVDLLFPSRLRRALARILQVERVLPRAPDYEPACRDIRVNPSRRKKLRSRFAAPFAKLQAAAALRVGLTMAFRADGETMYRSCTFHILRDRGASAAGHAPTIPS